MAAMATTAGTGGFLCASSGKATSTRRRKIMSEGSSNARDISLGDGFDDHEIGAIESAGEHKGEIYGGIYPADNKPIWFSVGPRLMDHYKASAWAEAQNGSLPTRKQGNYLTTLEGKGGALTEIFNRDSSFPAGYVWLREPRTFVRYDAWCQRLSDGDQDYFHRGIALLVLCVRR
jgi:hypothetical protein